MCLKTSKRPRDYAEFFLKRLREKVKGKKKNNPYQPELADWLVKHLIYGLLADERLPPAAIGSSNEELKALASGLPYRRRQTDKKTEG